MLCCWKPSAYRRWIATGRPAGTRSGRTLVQPAVPSGAVTREFLPYAGPSPPDDAKTVAPVASHDFTAPGLRSAMLMAIPVGLCTRP